MDADQRDTILQSLRQRCSAEVFTKFVRALNAAMADVRTRAGLGAYPLEHDETRLASIPCSLPDHGKDCEGLDGMSVGIKRRREKLMGQRYRQKNAANRGPDGGMDEND